MSSHFGSGDPVSISRCHGSRVTRPRFNQPMSRRSGQVTPLQPADVTAIGSGDPISNSSEHQISRCNGNQVGRPCFNQQRLRQSGWATSFQSAGVTAIGSGDPVLISISVISKNLQCQPADVITVNFTAIRSVDGPGFVS